MDAGTRITSANSSYHGFRGFFSAHRTMMPFISTIRLSFTHFCVKGMCVVIVLECMFNLIYPRVAGLFLSQSSKKQVVYFPVFCMGNGFKMFIVWV